jgi:hypothetical protein
MPPGGQKKIRAKEMKSANIAILGVVVAILVLGMVDYLL